MLCFNDDDDNDVAVDLDHRDQEWIMRVVVSFYRCLK